MASVTRTRLDRCATKGCPWPLDEDMHRPWCLSIPGVQHTREAQHQHVPKRSQGGKTVAAILCAYCHSRVDNTPDWDNKVIEFDDGEKVYRLWDVKTGEILIDRVIQDGVPTAEGEAEGQIAPRAYALPSAADIPVGHGPPMEDGEVEKEHGRLDVSLHATSPSYNESAGASRSGPRSAAMTPSYSFVSNGIEWEPEFTFQDWAEAASRVMDESQGRQWRVGDLVREERWQECSQYTDSIGYPPETQANYGKVAAAYELSERRPLPFSFHQTCYKLPDRLEWLDRALEEGWDRATLREKALGKKPKERRFSISQLRERADAWGAGDALPTMTDLDAQTAVRAFCDWLEQDE